MPLEAVVYPQDPFGYLPNCKDFMFHDLYSQEEFVAQDTKNNIDKLGHEQSFVEQGKEDDHQWRDYHQYPLLIPSLGEELGLTAIDVESHPPPQHRRKRRRTRNCKNKEEIENQRMTHIAVERNRRKQMNEYLAVLRSLMPSSYAQRGDQASIVGGAINYVKELEHILQSMEPKRTRTHDPKGDKTSTSSLVGPFTDFFSFPQYSTKSSSDVPESSSSPAEIEVTVAESHANIKIMTKKKPRQLLKLITSLQSLRLTLLHLNVTTLHNSILYSISVRVEEGSQLNTVDDIATALNQTIRRIQEET
ncbi:unnamed protein product [Arabidopsis thaliana]|uniref:BHLH domain-containing protein n=1 Tax=Arabidopsis thaliana TaxID=3702 RepID=A0A654EE18_ARATH|nr:unnamed protein product [Arabidopsis thaliana]